MNMEALRKALTLLDMEQLRTVNNMVVGQMRAVQGRMQSVAAGAFHVGQKVTFWSRKQGRSITLRIDKINTKTVSATEVHADGRIGPMEWRVSPTLLKAA